MEEKIRFAQEQAPGLGPDAIEQATKGLLGIDYRSARATLCISETAIRGYCTFIGDFNPLYVNHEYASKSVHGGIIAPPTMIGAAVIAPGLPGVQWIYSGTEWQFYRVVHAREYIVQRGRLTDVQKKMRKEGGNLMLQIGETICKDMRGELVAKATHYCFRIPRAKSGQGIRYEPRAQRWTREQIESIEAEIDAEEVRGAIPRYWEDVTEEEEIRPVVYGPLRNIDIAFSRGPVVMGMIGGTETEGSFVYQWLKRRRHPADVYTDPHTGVPDHPHRGHWEEEMAFEIGMPGRYDVGYQRTGMTAKVITNWMGETGFLKSLKSLVRRPNVVSDVTRFKARVVEKRVENGEHLVKCEIRAENQLGEITVEGNALVRLPSRAVSRPYETGKEDRKE